MLCERLAPVCAFANVGLISREVGFQVRKSCAGVYRIESPSVAPKPAQGQLANQHRDGMKRDRMGISSRHKVIAIPWHAPDNLHASFLASRRVDEYHYSLQADSTWNNICVM